MPSLVRLVAVLSFVATGFVSCNTDEEENNGEMLPVEMAFTTGLPVMLITTPDSCSITSKTDWIKKAQIIIVGPYKTELLRTEADIKGRGNVTWRLYPKKPYSLKTNSRISILGMKAAKRWVLLANWADRTLLRNDVAFECARHTSLEWTPSGTFVELVLNGEYQGTYYLCEKIQIDTCRLNIDTNDAYLMEIDDHYDEVNKFKSGLFHLPYQFREPDDDELTEEQFTYMEHYVEGLEKSLANEDMLMNGEFENWIDPQSFVDWWIVNELCYNRLFK